MERLPAAAFGSGWASLSQAAPLGWLRWALLLGQLLGRTIQRGYCLTSRTMILQSALTKGVVEGPSAIAGWPDADTLRWSCVTV
jgi:hypothetical protein